MKEMIDKAVEEPHLERVDVIIPVKNTKDNWEDCLKSFYRNVPINRLLISDGGCTDNTIDVVNQYPRVTVLDHRNTKSLGYSLKLLIKEVNTGWFVYFHSDVSIPSNWYSEMCGYKDKWDWFECKRIGVYHFEEELEQEFEAERAYSGSQMGKKEAFKYIDDIEDDYIYRMEDLLFRERIEKAGYKYGKVPSTFHYHHFRKLKHELEPNFKFITYREYDKDWEKYVADGMLRGVIKYMSPNEPENVEIVVKNIVKLKSFGEFHKNEWVEWVQKTNPEWIGVLDSKLKRNVNLNPKHMLKGFIIKMKFKLEKMLGIKILIIKNDRLIMK